MLSLVLAIGATLGLGPGSAYAFTDDNYIGRYASEQNTYHKADGTLWITCVAASALTTINYINLNDVSKATIKAWFDEGMYYNKKVYADGRDFGLDPRAWARLLFVHSPAGYTFNDYPAKLSPTWSQAKSNAYMVDMIRTSGIPAGALVAHGTHAFDVIGYQASSNPANGPYTLKGFYVIDPWYNGSSWSAYGATYDLAPNTYRTISDWNSHYFLTYTVEDTSPATWHNEYVVILRSSSGLVTDYPTAPWSDSHGGSALAFQESAEPAYSANHLNEAVVDGMTRNGLLNNEKGLGVRITNPSVGAKVFVSSAIADYPSYYLVEVRDRGKTVALAMVNVEGDGLHFAAAVATGPTFRLPNVDGARAAFRSHRFGAVSERLVWGWSDESMSPFAPIWEGEAADRTKLFLGPRGEATSSLHLRHGSP